MINKSQVLLPAIQSIEEGETAAQYALRVLEALLTEENTDAAIDAAVNHLPHIPGFVKPIIRSVLDMLMPNVLITMVEAMVAKHTSAIAQEPLGTPIHATASETGGAPVAGDPCNPDTFATDHPDWVAQGATCELKPQADGVHSSWVIVCD